MSRNAFNEPAGAVPKPRLNDRLRRLVDCYFDPAVNLNETKAAKMAGYKTADKYAFKLFRRPEVREEIERRQEISRKKFEVDEEWVIRRVMALADASLGDIKLILDQNDGDLSKLTHEQRYSLSEIAEEVYVEGRGEGARDVKKQRVKVADKLNALIALMRRLGLFKDEVTVKGEVSLIDRIQAGRNRLARGE